MGGRGESILAARRPRFLPHSNYRDTMSMTDQERIRHIQEQANKFVSRNKCVDSSLMTLIQQSKSSSVSAPTTVSAVINQGGCATNVVISGGGSGGEYFGILQVAQGCAICPDIPPTDTGVSPVIILPTPCINMNAPPFTQQNLSTIYTAPCSPGKMDYFPPPIYDGPGCTFNRITTPSG